MKMMVAEESVIIISAVFVFCCILGTKSTSFVPSKYVSLYSAIRRLGSILAGTTRYLDSTQFDTRQNQEGLEQPNQPQHLTTTTSATFPFRC